MSVLDSWTPAPKSTVWGEGMKQATFAIGKDETGTVYVHEGALPSFRDMAVVPLEPTEEQWSGLARDIILALDCNIKSGEGMLKHLTETLNHKNLPDYIIKELDNKGHLAKGDRAVLIYKAMIWELHKGGA